MKVMHVLNSRIYSGAEKVVCQIIKSFRDDVEMVYCSPDSDIVRQMLHAAKKNLTFHLWWHPHNIGVRTEAHLCQLEEIFRYYTELKETYGMQSLNMGEAAAILQK